MKLRCLTWNLGGNKSKGMQALEAAIRDLALRNDGWDACVAALQELPRGINSVLDLDQKILQILGGVPPAPIKAAVVSPNRGQALIVSSFFRLSKPEPGQKVLSVLLHAPVTKGWSTPLFLAGVHARSQLWASKDIDRSYHVGLLQDELLAAWLPGEEAVIMGDFNAQPYASEMIGTRNLYAFRDEEECIEAAKGTVRRPLFNPTWRLLAPPGVPPYGRYRSVDLNTGQTDPKGRVVATPHGTYRYTPETHSLHWHIYDQALVSPNLIPAVSTIDVLGMLDRKPVRPKKGRLSDHMPVELLLDLSQVTP